MILRFGLVSGIGWLVDFALFALLTRAGTPVALANFVGASTAVTYVFFASLRPIFRYGGRYAGRKLLLYWTYQALAVTAASWLIHAVSALGVAPLLSKVLVTPLTFVANFLFMRWLARER